MAFLKKILDYNAKDIKKYSKVVESINALEPEVQSLSDAELVAKTGEFRQALANGANLNELLPEAFAVVREASQRVLGMRHFDVQLIGGMVLHDGRIAEMKTGEGKTLVATAPVYLNALAGKGVHVITVNDYLAKRDSEWMGRIYKFLGMSVGLSIHGMDGAAKRASYLADVTYGTNNEFGFDYLRDNMAVRAENMVQRTLDFAIVDEVDSILVDEARTPLIISGQSAKSNDLYYQVAKIIPRLKPEEDYTIDIKARLVALTDEGLARVEKMLAVENLYEPENMEINHHVQQALKAQALFRKDRDYVIKDGEVIIVDEFTGRLMFGRRYSEGLHQAIEAKEGVKIARESQTLATITFQNYFRMYKKLAGMTGTAKTEEEEFQKIYGFDVVEVPTNLPMIRDDLSDMIYRTKDGKYAAVVEEIYKKHQIGQPVLVGTISIEQSELLSHLLKRRGIPHQVLNAKFHEKEAEIVAQAGRLGAVTIATNMAGRGTDIVLGGNPEFLAREEMAKNTEREFSKEEVTSLIEKYKVQTKAEHEKVKELGGLAILGTERHDSRRIDNQLRGRAGRQGDPGSSRFYISMEDELMRRFGGDNIVSLMDKIGMDDSMPIDNNMVSRSIESAQKRVEARNFEARKHVLEYDDVINQQREVIYAQRMDVLRGSNLRDQVMHMLEANVNRVITRFSAESEYPEDWDLPGLMIAAQNFLPQHKFTEEYLASLTKKEIAELFLDEAKKFYAVREDRIGQEIFRDIERQVIIRIVDDKWMNHIDSMDQLKLGVGLRAYGHEDPLVVYKYEAFDMFDEMIAEIQDDVVRYMQRVEVVEKVVERQNIVTGRGGEVGQAAAPSVKKPTTKGDDPFKNVGRNDLCPCGSGKKYKKCCGKNLED